MKGLLLTFCMLGVVFSAIPHFTRKQISDKIDGTKIMYGATIRIRAVLFPYYLHSHSVLYPRGSGQQSVTGFGMDDDYNSLWTIKQSHHQTVKTYYHQLLCGDTIRLQHALTKKNLHSEQIYQSMITNGQEVSAFGSGGNGDDSTIYHQLDDNWVLKCLNKQNGQAFFGGDNFQLMHQNSDKYLKMNRYYQYQHDNWENVPFQGQIEVCATDNPTRQTEFKIVGGIFFKESAQKTAKTQENNQDL